ncbi:MAG: ABC-three component system protein [Opitutaceae bacterium]
MSSAKITENGELRGTAWLIDPTHAVTAAHCVSQGIDGIYQLSFQSSTGFHEPVDAKVVSYRDTLDGALLEILGDMPANLTALEVCYRGSSGAPSWQADGFPQITEELVNSFRLDGAISLLSTTRSSGDPVIQLSCNQADRPYNELTVEDGSAASFLIGSSGSAIIVPSQNNRVVGIISFAPKEVEGTTIFATPIDALWEHFQEHLPNVIPHTWQGDSHLFIRSKEDSPEEVETNLTTNDIDRIWTVGSALKLDCDLFTRSSPFTESALLRIMLHSKGHTDISTAQLPLLQQKLNRAMIDCIPISQPVSVLLNTNTGINNRSGHIHSDDSFAKEIHRHCDRWVLGKIDNELKGLFLTSTGQTVEFDGYTIAADIIDSMKKTWENWYSELNQGDGSLLHHFLTLMLTPHSDHNIDNDVGIGVGPLTIDRCILTSMIFSLALVPLMDEVLTPKRPDFGNLGSETWNGHSCGIVTYQNAKLDTHLVNHKWLTKIILLSGFEQSAEVLMTEVSRLDTSTSSQSVSLDQTPPSSLIIPCDRKIRIAISQGVEALTLCLRERFKKHDLSQVEYIEMASNTNI